MGRKATAVSTLVKMRIQESLRLSPMAETILNNSLEVTNAMKEQSAVTSEIIENVNAIKQLTLANVTGASKNATSATSVVKQTGSLERAVVNLKT